MEMVVRVTSKRDPFDCASRRFAQNQRRGTLPLGMTKQRETDLNSRPRDRLVWKFVLLNVAAVASMIGAASLFPNAPLVPFVAISAILTAFLNYSLVVFSRLRNRSRSEEVRRRAWKEYGSTSVITPRLGLPRYARYIRSCAGCRDGDDIGRRRPRHLDRPEERGIGVEDSPVPHVKVLTRPHVRGGWRDHAKYVRRAQRAVPLRVVFVKFPAGWIHADVFARVAKIIFVANNVFVITALPYRKARPS